MSDVIVSIERRDKIGVKSLPDIYSFLPDVHMQENRMCKNLPGTSHEQKRN
jgi:hypothetical protein